MTPKQLVFVTEYLVNGLNATAAYKLAYGIASDEVAAVNASRLLRNAKVQEHLLNYRIQLMQSTQLTINEVVNRINELSQTAKADTDRLKALDMLMKHLGGYVTAQDLAANLSEEQRERLLEELLKRVDK